jgi:hypothetical protein
MLNPILNNMLWTKSIQVAQWRINLWVEKIPFTNLQMTKLFCHMKLVLLFLSSCPSYFQLSKNVDAQASKNLLL